MLLLQIQYQYYRHVLPGSPSQLNMILSYDFKYFSGFRRRSFWLISALRLVLPINLQTYQLPDL